ncbi:hypothetical protein [Priestia megaterium]|uniref:hypothetical protein n=1 Tax=Priestia megaterium TaxID=1404 RepID=UPI002E1D7C78|nr:hypothetical protein [Priestia megaterium]
MQSPIVVLSNLQKQVTDGEPDTSRDVSPVRGGAFENLLQKCRKALGAYSTNMQN